MNSWDLLQAYVDTVSGTFRSGNATEGSYYPALKSFLEGYSRLNKIDCQAVVLPKRTEGGMPDFLLRGKNRLIGNVEAKDLPADLREIDKSEQLQRYKHAYPNLILTDFFTFVLYRDGREVSRVTIAEKNTLLFDSKVPKIINEKGMEVLLRTYLSYSSPPSKTAKQLAISLGTRARQLSDLISDELKGENKMFHQLYEVVRNQLIPSLTLQSFADIYAQTLTYGLFFAKVKAGTSNFDRINAYNYLPSNIPLLPRLFYVMQDPSLIDSMKWLVDDMIDVLNNASIETIAKDFHTRTWSEDPVIHFYETFLSKYNPEEREGRGVYYTPAPVVAYIVSSIQLFLQDEFNKTDGLADRSVTVLDPAAGTLTFPSMAIRLMKEFYDKKGRAGVFPSLVREHILKNYYAFELLLAPYVIGHFKVSLTLEDLGCPLNQGERFQLYLTNTLEPPTPKTQEPLFPELAKESENAGRVKSEEPIFVIFGNPPYSVKSYNKSEFIEGLMNDYKEDVRNERNIQPLSDDYLKFLRFAQWKIADKGNQGIVGMITNNAYLNGLIHKGVRRKLYESFDQIYILNLHGDIRSHEEAPDQKKNENVFDIQTGVAIVFLLRNGKEKEVHYADLWGSREQKYEWLTKNNYSTTEWTILKPKGPHYWFIPRPPLGEYEKFPLLSDLMPFHRQGVKTHRDWLVVGFDRHEIESRLDAVIKSTVGETMSALRMKENDKETIVHAKKLVSALPGIIPDQIIPYSYRPFDDRFVYYDHILLDRPRPELYKQLGTLFLVTRRNSRQWPGEWTFAHVAEKIPDIDMRGGSFVFPLAVDNAANFSEEFVQALAKQYGSEPKPKDIFAYIYAILNTPVYRTRYAAELRLNFPRIPLTSDKAVFDKMVQHGKKLISLHLLSDPELDSVGAGFPQTGSDTIATVDFDESRDRVVINEKQWFSRVSREIWAFEVGGYQVAKRWLYERKGRKLSSDELRYYMRMVGAIRKTLEVREKLDEVYPEIEKKALAVSIRTAETEFGGQTEFGEEGQLEGNVSLRNWTEDENSGQT